MRVVSEPGALAERHGKRGFVPTMGALHQGHASLMRRARAISDEVVVSIFVNPTQFGPTEDFGRYPRTPSLDLELCESTGVDYVFMPSVEQMYPDGLDAVSVRVGAVGDRWDGALRPGHFDGVATVVLQLFLMVRPDLAVFGAKDLQQCAVITKLASALNLGIEIHRGETMRETDGLAISSRNVYLSAEDRAIAPRIYELLNQAKSSLLESPGQNASDLLNDISGLFTPLFKLQYLALVNRDSMEPTSGDDKFAHLIVAAYLGQTRLIDNIPLYT